VKTNCVKCHDKSTNLIPPCVFSTPPEPYDCLSAKSMESLGYIQCAVINELRLANAERFCSNYLPDLYHDGYDWKFVDKSTNEEIIIKRFDSELASLRAQKINPNLTFKGGL
jgi:hypothetical protein